MCGFRLQIQLAEQGRYIYAHEISGGWLPEIETIIRQPKYFLNNVQDLDWRPNVDISERVRDTHFPSVFFGASGSSSPLHSDGVSSPKIDFAYFHSNVRAVDSSSCTR